MNTLILSAGTRNKIVQYFKKSTTGKVVATDMQRTAPAIYEADSFYIVHPITHPEYIGQIIDICIKEKIDAVVSLIDPELSLLAKNKDKFDKVGTTVIGSSYELCERAYDKIQMYKWLLEHNYKCAKSYDNLSSFYKDKELGIINYPVFVKPIRGSASINISLVDNNDSLEYIFNHNKDMMIQEYIKGQEIGVDCYIDMISGDVVSIFSKKKILMKSGETDKAVSFKDQKLFDLVERFVKESGWRGQIDIDIFEVNGEYYISEVNPRFGGGYPHAYECGCDHIKLIENNVNKNINKKSIGNYDENVYMMKYSEIMIKHDCK